MYHNSRSNSYSNSRGNSYNRGRSSQYVWRVSWLDYHCNPKHRAFASKQQAMIFMSNIDNGRNCNIFLDKWYGN